MILGVILAEAFGLKLDDVKEIAALCEIVHNGTLIVDDIEDNRYGDFFSFPWFFKKIGSNHSSYTILYS